MATAFQRVVDGVGNETCVGVVAGVVGDDEQDLLAAAHIFTDAFRSGGGNLFAGEPLPLVGGQTEFFHGGNSFRKVRSDDSIAQLFAFFQYEYAKKKKA